MGKVSFENPTEKEFAKIFDDLTFLNFNNVVLNLIASFPWDTLRLRLSNSNFLTFLRKKCTRLFCHCSSSDILRY